MGGEEREKGGEERRRGRGIEMEKKEGEQRGG